MTGMKTFWFCALAVFLKTTSHCSEGNPMNDEHSPFRTTSTVRGPIFEIEYEHDYFLIQLNTSIIRSKTVTLQYRDLNENDYQHRTIKVNDEKHQILNLQDGTFYIICVQTADNQTLFFHNLDSNCQILLTKPRLENTVLIYKKHLPMLITVFCVSDIAFFLLGFLIRQYIETKKRRKRPHRQTTPDLPERPSWTLLETITGLTGTHTSDVGSYIDPADLNLFRRYYNKNENVSNKKNCGVLEKKGEKRNRSRSLPFINHDINHDNIDEVGYIKLLAENEYESISSGSYASVQTIALKLRAFRRLESLYDKLSMHEMTEKEKQEIDRMKRSLRHQMSVIVPEASTLHL